MMKYMQLNNLFGRVTFSNQRRVLSIHSCENTKLLLISAGSLVSFMHSPSLTKWNHIGQRIPTVIDPSYGFCIMACSITLSGNLAHGIEEICTISTDMSGISDVLKEWRGSDGKYWTVDFNIGIQFGGTELQAYLEWTKYVSDNCPEFNTSLMLH